ncbi:MAG: element excision factor XisH family protein [Spirulinaceae cyanobacterium]
MTDDPLRLKIGRRAVMIDLGAKKLLAAERGEQKIAVEVKSFLGPSAMNDLENALGQFILYAKILAEQEPDRLLYLAINLPVFKEIFSEEVGQLVMETTELRLIVFDATTKEILKWIPSIDTAKL